MERDGHDEQASVNLFGFTPSAEIHVSIYYGDDGYLPKIERIWETLTDGDG